MLLFEDSLVAIVIGQLDLDGVVVEQLSRALAANFVHFVEALPGEADRSPAVLDVEPGLERAEADFAAELGSLFLPLHRADYHVMTSTR